MSRTDLERRLLVALLSLITETDGAAEVPVVTLYSRCYSVTVDGRDWEAQRRSQRQSMRRALGRLHRAGLVTALALGWLDVADPSTVRGWQGGGRGRTPRWRAVGLTADGLRVAEELTAALVGTDPVGGDEPGVSKPIELVADQWVAAGPPPAGGGDEPRATRRW